MPVEVRALSNALCRGDALSSVNYRLLVVTGGVGEQHCHNMLGLTAKELDFEQTLDPAILANRLRLMKKKLESEHANEVRPVLICDEYTCVCVLHELKREGRLLFPLTTRESTRHIPIRQEFPRYRVSIATSRNQEEFFEFLRESLTT